MLFTCKTYSESCFLARSASRPIVKLVIGAIQVDRSIPISSLRDGILESASTLAASTTSPPA